METWGQPSACDVHFPHSTAADFEILPTWQWQLSAAETLVKVQLYPGSRTAGQPLSLKSSGMDTVCVGVMVMFVSFSMLVNSRRSGGWVWGVDGCCACSYLIACQYACCYAGANVTPSNPHHSLFTMKPRVRHTTKKQKQKKRKEE